MNRLLLLLLCTTIPALADDGFKAIFDGKTLAGWESPHPGVWHVADGAITGINTAEKPIAGNRFLNWEGEVEDFELKLKFRIEGPPNANSGIQFRGHRKPDGHFVGYQADIDRAGKWLGALYDEHTGRRMLAARGQTTHIAADGTRASERHADPAELLKAVDLEGWNEYHLTARGPVLELRINGKLTAKVVDRETGEADARGQIALQVHSGPAMQVQFKDIHLKRLAD